MTAAHTVGAISIEAAEWYAIDWPSVYRNVRRLQVRIVKAMKENRWSKVKVLQRLLTCSYSGKVLAVRRVTENDGKETPGVDRVGNIILSPYDVFTSRKSRTKMRSGP